MKQINTIHDTIYYIIYKEIDNLEIVLQKQQLFPYSGMLM